MKSQNHGTAAAIKTKERGITMTDTNNPALAPTSKPSRRNNRQVHSIRPLTKLERVLVALAAGQSFNRFEAERVLNDHCLHSTVSTIQSKGVPVERRDEVVPGYQGSPTHVCRYWLTAENIQQARRLLGLV